MEFEYAFDIPSTNLYLSIGLLLYFCIGFFASAKLIFVMYHSEYKKDPSFEQVPTALRWKQLLFMIVSPFFIAIPLLGGIFAIGITMFYFPSIVFDYESISIVPYSIITVLYSVYLVFGAKRFHQWLYQFIQKDIEFEQYFRSHTKNWGFSTSGEPIQVSNKEYKGLGIFLMILLHGGLVPVFIMTFIEFLCSL